jgi:3-methyladenine DNA glycosylase AlkD
MSAVLSDMSEIEKNIDSEDLIANILNDLKPHIDEEYKILCRDQFKIDVGQSLGVRTSRLREIAVDYHRRIKSFGIDPVFKICEDLLETQIKELRGIAFQWGYMCQDDYEPKHFDMFERWLEIHVKDWGDCDGLCINALGVFVCKFPEMIPRIKEWTQSPNRWKRRGSAVVLIFSLRRGKYFKHALDMADKLLLDKDDMVQKGYGWMLKEATKLYAKEVFDYVMTNKRIMPRTSLRYAIEKLPEQQRKNAMRRD